jgi:plasmid replication initiation protein
MASSSLKPLFISSNSSSDDLFELLKCENDLFKDLMPNNEDDVLSLPSFILFFSFSSKYPAKRYKL